MDNHLIPSIGVALLSLSAIQLVLYLVLPYEQYRRMKIELYRENIADFHSRFEKVGDAGKERIAESTPDLLAHELRSFTFARPAIVCACIGGALVLFGAL